MNIPDPSLLDLFQDALKAEGFDGEVVHHFEPTRQADVIHVKKEINGETRHAKEVFTVREQEMMDDLEQFVAQRAGRLVRSFDEFLTERVEWGGKCVQFDMKDSYSATCFQCGATVNIEELDKQTPIMAETAVPNPVTYTSFDDLPQVKIRMTLQAILRDNCDPMCPNSGNRKI